MMKRLSTALLLCLLTVTAAIAGPQIKWVSTVHDFGAFDENDGRVTCRMSFVNEGDAPLVITSARATCGCTTPAYSKEEIMPGDSGHVDISFNPIGRPGRFDKKVYIETNTKPSRSTLTIKGVVIGASNTVRSKFPVDAGALKLRTTVIPFGEIEKGRTKSMFFDAYNSSGDTVYVAWEGLPSYLSVAGAEDFVAPGDYASFAFSFASDMTPLYGIVTDSIYMIPDTRRPDDKIRVTAVGVVKENFAGMTDVQRRKAPVIGIVPESVDLNVVNRDSAPIKESVTVKNHGIDPLKIRRIYTSDPGISIKAEKTEIKKGKPAKIMLEIDPKAFSGKAINAKVVVISNDPDNPTTSFRIVGELK